VCLIFLFLFFYNGIGPVEPIIEGDEL
jgi:hypothetical protein